MKEFVRLMIGSVVLVIGYFIGDIVRRQTSDEQKDGKVYFLILTVLGLMSGLFGMIIGKDWLMFFAFFVAMFSSRSMVSKSK